MYYKGKWCTAGGKDPLFGHVDGFQIDPKIFKKGFNCPKGKEFSIKRTEVENGSEALKVQKSPQHDCCGQNGAI